MKYYERSIMLRCFTFTGKPYYEKRIECLKTENDIETINKRLRKKFKEADYSTKVILSKLLPDHIYTIREDEKYVQPIIPNNKKQENF